MTITTTTPSFHEAPHLRPQSHSESQGGGIENPVPRLIEQLLENRWLEGADEERKLWLETLGTLLVVLRWQGNALRLSDVLPRNMAAEGVDELLNALTFLGYTAQAMKWDDLPTAEFPVLVIVGRENAIGKEEGGVPLVVTNRGTVDGSWQVAELYSDGTLSTLERNIAQAQVLQMFTVSRSDQLLDSSEEFARQQTGVSWMRLTMDRFRGLFLQLVAVSFIIGMLTIAVPLFVMMVYNLVIDSHAMPSMSSATSLLLKLLVGVSLAMALETALRIAVVRSLSWFGARMQVIVGTALIEQFLSLSPAVTERAAAADQLSRIRAFDTMRDFISGPQMLSMLEIPWSLALLVVIGLIGGEVVLIPMGGIVLYALLAYAVRKPLEYEIFRSARSSSERQQAAMDMLTRLPAMRYAGVAGALFARYSAAVRRAMHTTFRINLMVAILEHSAYAITAVVGLLTLIFGLFSIWAGQLTVGALVAVMILTWRLLGIIQANCVLQPRWHYLRNSNEQINRLMTLRPEDADYQHEVPPQGLKGHLECHGAVLRYSRSGEFVLRNVMVNIEPGELVAVMGQTGSGKSSLLKLLCGLYPTQAGSIRVDGTNIRQYVPHSLRQHMAYMPQQPDFFTGTIADNLRLVAPTSSEADLRAAIEKAGADDEISAMPTGMATEIGIGRNHLPLSLSHRLNLARIYLQQPKVMLLDELPYDVLNSPTGEKFHQALREWKGKRTVIFVTHRIDFAEQADQVIWLRHDMPPLAGTPKQVLAAMQKEK